MPTWQVQFDGGFAWMFDGDKSATVAIPKKPVNSSSVAHEMVLIVGDPARLDPKATTLPGRPRGDALEFVLRGPVDIRIDKKDEGNTGIKRNVSKVPPPAGVTDNFYFVYSIERLSQAGGAPKPKGTWRDDTLSTLKLDGGRVTVLPARFNAEFDIKNGDGGLVTSRRLSSSLLYVSDSPVHETLAFKTRDGDVVLIPGGQNLALTIEANCTCANNHPAPGDALDGFDLVFNLYSALKKEFQLTPHVPAGAHVTLSPLTAGPISPGPDCPPSDHPI